MIKKFISSISNKKNNKCLCDTPPFNYMNYLITELGIDKFGGEVSIEKCNKCNSKWVKYLIEEPHYSQSGRWWRAKITNYSINLDNSRKYIENQKQCFIGGSFYRHAGKLFIGKIIVK